MAAGALINALPAAVYSCDADGIITSYNAAAAELWGRSPEIGKDRWSGWLKVHTPEGRELSPDEFPTAIALRTGKPVKCEELVIRAADGSERHVLSNPQLLRDDTGKLIGAVNMLVDITDRRRAEKEKEEAERAAARFKETEERLHLAEMKFRSFATHAPIGIFLASPTGESLFVNEKWCELSGIAMDDALGAGWVSAVHPEDRERVVTSWGEAVAKRLSFDSEFRFLRPDGSVTWTEATARPWDGPNGEYEGYLGCCNDITDRKRSEEAISLITQESDRKRRLYEGLLTNTPDLAYVFDLQHRFIFVNDALLRMWGRTLEDSLGKTCLEIGYEPWHAEMHNREIDEIARTKRPIRGEVPFPHETLGVRIYDYILTPLIGVDGEVECVTGITRDVTERKRLEERALFLNELMGKLTPLHHEKEIVSAAVEALGTHLRAARCYFVECHPEEDRITISNAWSTPGQKDLSGVFALHEFANTELWDQVQSGAITVEDVEKDPLITPTLQRFREFGIRSWASQPFKETGKRTVTLAVAFDKPHSWMPWEMSLLDHVIARVWPLVGRARSEAALRESQRRLRLVSDHVPALIGHVDRNEVFQFANGRYTEWFGLSPDELVGKPLSAIMGPEVLAHRRPYLDRVMAGEAVTFEGPTLHKQLGVRELHVSYEPDIAPDGTVIGFYVMALDITERKRSEVLLARHARQSRILWEAAGVIFTTDDADEMLKRVFAKINELLEVDAYFNFMVNPAGDALELVSSHGVSDETRESLRRLEFGQAICGTVAQTRKSMVREGIDCSDDPLVQVVKGCGARAYACNPLIAGGELLGTLSFASSTRDRFEADEIEFMETIAHYITAAYVRLRLVGNLRTADRRKDEFLATLAHELRNPLAPIRTGLEIMRMTGNDPVASERVLSTMERQVDQLVTLVNDLLDVSRITRGKLQLRKSIINLADVVRSATEASQPAIDQAEQTLRLHLPGRSVELEADPNRLAQIISNLLTNASKYSGKASEITLEATERGDTLLIKVTDQGIGIPSEMLGRIFEMFTQVEDGTGQNQGGLGIGLTLVKSLVEMHGGSVWAESDGPGQGTVVQVRLPLHKRIASAPRSKITDAGNSAHNRKVLVVDDNKPAAETLSMALGLMGHDVRTAFNGPDGIALAESFDPEITFLDLGMPGMDGCETARRIRALSNGSRITLVALTGWGQEEVRKRTTDAGFNHHLVKPADPALLRAILNDPVHARPV